MTPEERRLWYDFLKALPLTVKRQEVFGSYIVDFYIPQIKLVIEVDGKQHLSGKVYEKDLVRDAYFDSLAILVLRVYNEDVRDDFSGVCQVLAAVIEEESKRRGLR